MMLFRLLSPLLLSGFLFSPLGATDDPFGVMKLSPISCPSLDNTKPLSLSSAVSSALCANPQTHSAWASVTYQEALLGGSKAAYLPTVTLNGTALRNHDTGYLTTQGNYTKTNGSLALNYLLYDFGNRDALHDQATFALFSAQKSYDNLFQTLFFNTVQGYYAIFQAQASLDAYLSAQNAAKESLEAAHIKLKAGVTIPADTLQAQAAYAQALLNRVTAEQTLALAKGNFATLLGWNADQSFTIIPPVETTQNPLPQESLHALVTKASHTRPDLIAAHTDVQTADATLRAARASGMPTLSLTSGFSGMDTSMASPTTNSNVGVVLSVPLFTGYAITYKIAAATAQRSLKEALANTLDKQVALEVYTAYTNLMAAHTKEQLTTDLLNSAKASYASALGRYKAGVGTILDVTTAQSLLSSAQQQKVASLYTLAISRVALAKALGNTEQMKDELTKEVP